MALDAAELPPPPAPEAPEGGGNFLTNKVGGLPVWGWGAVIVGGAVLGLFLLPKLFGGGGSQAATSSGGDTGTSGVVPNAATGGQGPISTGGQGIQGVVGPAGAQGIQGIMGATGATGATGAQGPAGTPGQVIPLNAFRPDTWQASYNYTLADIAQMHYGNASYWELVAQANSNLHNASAGTIPAQGQTLNLPAL